LNAGSSDTEQMTIGGKEGDSEGRNGADATVEGEEEE
jgi:hypothetical protein